MKKLVLFGFLAIAFVLCTGTAYAAYYGVYDIRDTDGDGDIDGDDGPEALPGTEHFDWVNRTYTYQGQSGSNVSFDVDFTLYAPNSWDSGTYGAYQDATLGDDYLYSYYYQVTYTGAENQLKGLEIPYYPAEIASTGESGIGAGTSFENNFPEPTTTVSFYEGLNNYLGSGETSQSFYMTSGNWWGWQQLTYDSLSGADGFATGSTLLSSNGSDYSPSGHLPAPNPEASTVALYIVGLIGMGTLYYRKKKMAEMEI